jgi:uncharacterized GH25 family protein
MFRSIRSALSLLLCLAVVTAARGHFLFIAVTESADGKRAAEVYFSDTAEAGDADFIDKIAGTRLWLQTKPGEFQPLVINKGKDRLTAALPGDKNLIVVGICEYGVLKRKTPFLLRHFPRAMIGSVDELKPCPRVPLEIVGNRTGGKMHLTVLRQGKPVPNAEIWTLAKDLSGGKLQCDAEGCLNWEPPAEGWYMVYTSDFHKAAGMHEGEAYQEIRDFASLSFQWGKAGAE